MATPLVPNWQRATWRKGGEEGKPGVELLPAPGRGWREIPGGWRGLGRGQSPVTGTLESVGASWEPEDTGRGQTGAVKGCWGEREAGRQRGWWLGEPGRENLNRGDRGRLRDVGVSGPLGLL